MWHFDPLVYQVASISRLLWKEYTYHFEDAQTVLKLGERKLFAFPSFTLEVFHRLYYEPQPDQLDPSPPESVWAQKLHDQFSQLIGFDQLIEQCCGNQLAAGLATVEYCRKVYEKLPPPRPQFANPQQYRDAIKRLKQKPGVPPSQALKDMLNYHSPKHTQGKPPPKTKQQQEAEQWLLQLIEQSEDDALILTQILQREGKRAVFEAQQYAVGLESTQIRSWLRAALSASEQKLEELAQWLEMIGLSWGNESGLALQVSPQKKLALAQKIATNDKLKQIAKLAGRFKQIGDRKRRSKAKDARSEITTIELGNNLSRLLPSELQKLTSPALFPLFAKGYYDRSLLQYKTSGKEKQSIGPLVICLDSSGSMNGLPDTWAKAVTAVLGQIAYQEHRHLRVIHFATSVCRVDDFPPRHQDYSRLLESMLCFYTGGGTDWQPALYSAIECIEKQQHLKQADIVMVTDGKCDVEWEFLEQLRVKKQQLEFNVYGVLISEEGDQFGEEKNGGRFDHTDQSVGFPNPSKTLTPHPQRGPRTPHFSKPCLGEQKLKKFCDRVWAVKDLVSEDCVIEELFLL